MTSRLPLDLARLDAWLVGQRWFRSKARPLRAVSVHDSIPLPAGNAMLLVLLASYVDGAEERYLVPAVGSTDPPREAADGDGVWRIAARADDGRAHGCCRATTAGWCWNRGRRWTSSLPGGRAAAEDLAERAMGVEQSNTSVRLGDRLMLKIYRLLEPGVNPEVEVLELLTERGFAHAPLAAGSMRYVPDDAEPAAAGIVQSLVPAHGDAWAWMLEHLAARSGEPEGAIASASEIGGITAELHAALQSVPDRPDFPSRAATAGGATVLAGWCGGAAGRRAGGDAGRMSGRACRASRPTSAARSVP